jgi:hypothetical protein
MYRITLTTPKGTTAAEAHRLLSPQFAGARISSSLVLVGRSVFDGYTTIQTTVDFEAASDTAARAAEAMAVATLEATASWLHFWQPTATGSKTVEVAR